MEAERWAHLEALEDLPSGDPDASDHLAIARWIKRFIVDGTAKEELLAEKALQARAANGENAHDPESLGTYMQSDSGQQGAV